LFSTVHADLSNPLPEGGLISAKQIQKSLIRSLTMTDTPFARLIDIAGRYGSLSLENYATIRSLAERLRAGFC